MFEESCNTKVKYPILGFAPGYYSNNCANCNGTFMGDKYSRQCEPCAINNLNENLKSALVEIGNLEEEIEEYKTAIKVISNLKEDAKTDKTTVRRN